MNMISCEVVKEIRFDGVNGIGEFLNIKSISNKTIEYIKEVLLNIRVKDVKLELLSILLDRWVLYDLDGETVYVKHVASKTERKNMLYQIVLGGSNSGIYEFHVKGKKIDVKGYEINGKNTLVIESKGNYEASQFRGNNNQLYTMCRLDFKSDEEFEKALIKTGLISKEDIEIYLHADDLVKPYIDKVLPRVIFK